MGLLLDGPLLWLLGGLHVSNRRRGSFGAHMPLGVEPGHSWQDLLPRALRPRVERAELPGGPRDVHHPEEGPGELVNRIVFKLGG